ncbi:MAG: ABC transporter ATP-binding protein [Ignavibacteriaceae bacterium]|jgi:ABC-type antimicrobial peptide transport system, ATPase component|nr:MAG: ABC transporter ATP-binding protein [Chlorobiota bacterium]KXK04869.1 MAG: Lipoprotein-releasing system ATP-binding protein [Chlorobi bacterium OLB4]MBV6397686.1 putative ABC transporter ATP-binding protein [Ignavibacteria bacterium]MCC6885466.1 ABC transporter ATP-binding protein [Ignavibacteriales bacterium]MCE7952818.1 ABC transporter ATP-binding protein [Chlorobi bacterium CHB7]MDL1887015.1 ABC transporter ATP-binding protein [Ignavibacteria bacterium CHB1]MEB2328787.1 ABC transpo
MNKFIRINLINKSYSEGKSLHRVLNDVSVSFSKAEIAILLGRSGSGKSTLLNLMSGIDLPDSGTIIIGDTDITTLSEQDRTIFRRKHIGFVFQFFNLIPTLTVLENVLLPLELNGKHGKISEREAIEVLDEVGLVDRIKSYPDILSGGEQQRVAIARAIIHDPLLILADEPTGNLDAENAQIVINLLDKLVRRRNKTMIMATHSKEVIGLADTIFRVADGKLIRVETGKL